MFCDINALTSKMTVHNECVEVNCNAAQCRFHVNNGKYTKCNNPHLMEKYDKINVMCAYVFVDGCKCDKCDYIDCPYQEYEVEHVPENRQPQREWGFITYIAILIISGVILYYGG